MFLYLLFIKLFGLQASRVSINTCVLVLVIWEQIWSTPEKLNKVIPALYILNKSLLFTIVIYIYLA